MVLFTYAARLADGVLLVASIDSSSTSPVTSQHKADGKSLIKQLTHRSPKRCTVESGAYNFHYLIEGEIVYLILSAKSYPKRLAYGYLDEVRRHFEQHVEQDGARIATIDRPYYFIKFDKTIQRLRRSYADPHSAQNMSKLNNELADIHNIMKQNIQDVLDRGEKLDHVSQISTNLVSESKKFKWGAKKLNLMAFYKKYGPLAAGGLFVTIFLYLRYFW